MTPEREAYLAKCSRRESTIRTALMRCKFEIQKTKWALNNDKTFNEKDIRYCKKEISRRKYFLNAYRHELARIKGMDRVVAPEVYHSTGVCHCPKCATAVWVSSNNYCPQCGRRLLWEKAKK